MQEEDIENIQALVDNAEALLFVLKDACITNELIDEKITLEITLKYLRQIEESLSNIHYEMFIKPNIITDISNLPVI